MDTYNFSINPNKIVNITSNDTNTSYGNTWRSNISRILSNHKLSASTNTIFSNLGNELDVKEDINLLMQNAPPALESIDMTKNSASYPIQDFLKGESGGVLESASKLANKLITKGGTYLNIGLATADAITGNSSAATADTFQPWTVGVPTWNPEAFSKAKGSEFSYNFDFRLGQYGLWNAKEEVVLPILNLIAPAFPRELTAWTVSASFPTTVELLASIVADGLSAADDLVNQGLEYIKGSIGSNDTELSLEASSSVDSSIFNEIGTALQNLIANNYYKFTYDISFGNLVTYRKCLVTKAKATYSQETDENGYPIAGTADITFTSIIPISLSYADTNQQAIRLGVN